MPRAYCITTEAIAKERQRVGGDLEKFDVTRVIQLDELELPELGPRDCQLRILAERFPAARHMAFSSESKCASRAERRQSRS